MSKEQKKILNRVYTEYDKETEQLSRKIRKMFAEGEVSESPDTVRSGIKSMALAWLDKRSEDTLSREDKTVMSGIADRWRRKTFDAWKAATTQSSKQSKTSQASSTKTDKIKRPAETDGETKLKTAKTANTARSSTPGTLRKRNDETSSDLAARKLDEKRTAYSQATTKMGEAWRDITGATLDVSPPPTTLRKVGLPKGRSILGSSRGKVQTDSITFDNDNFIRGPNDPKQRYSGFIGTSGFSLGEIEHRAREGLSSDQGGYVNDHRGSSRMLDTKTRQEAMIDNMILKSFKSLYGDDATVPIAPVPMESFSTIMEARNDPSSFTSNSESKETKLKNKRLAWEMKSLETLEYRLPEAISTAGYLSKYPTFKRAEQDGYAAEWAKEFIEFAGDGPHGTSVLLTESQLESLGDMSMLSGYKRLTKDQQANRAWLNTLINGKGEAMDALKNSILRPGSFTAEQLTSGAMTLPGFEKTHDWSTLNETFQDTKGGKIAVMSLDQFRQSEKYTLLQQYPHWESIQKAAWSDEVTDDQVLEWASQHRQFVSANTEILMTNQEREEWMKELIQNLPDDKLSGCSGAQGQCQEWCNAHGVSSNRQRGAEKHNWSFDTVNSRTEGTIAHANSDVVFDPSFKPRGEKSERRKTRGTFGRRSLAKSTGSSRPDSSAGTSASSTRSTGKKSKGQRQTSSTFDANSMASMKRTIDNWTEQAKNAGFDSLADYAELFTDDSAKQLHELQSMLAGSSDWSESTGRSSYSQSTAVTAF